MNPFDVQSLISTVDHLIFSHTGEHLDDLQHAILEGTFNHQKYAEIAKTNHLSEKYVKEMAGKLWHKLSEALGEEVSKSNLKSTLQRYYYSNFSNSNVINSNSIKIHKSHICTNAPESQLNSSNLEQQTKLEIANELIKEGLSIEQIARVVKLPLELVEQQIINSE